MLGVIKFSLISALVLLNTACSPHTHQPVDISISLLSGFPQSLSKQIESQPKTLAQANADHWLNRNLLAAKEAAANNDSDYIAFYSDHIRHSPVSSTAFSYVTALALQPENIRKFNDQLSKSTPVLASNINFGLPQSGSHVFAYNPSKTRADAYIRQYKDENIAYLSLINQYKSVDAAPELEDIQIIRHTVDRLHTLGINKIILISQFSAQETSEMLDQIKGVDVIMTTDKTKQVKFKHHRCYATFTPHATHLSQLNIRFDEAGQVTACQF